MKSPLVSVVMSVFNGDKYLIDSINSILNQSYKEFEFIIINDGSTDGTSQILNEYAKKDSRVSIINHMNMGLTKSLNIGVGLAKGELIARQDADDISLPIRLEKQVNHIMRDPHSDLIASWYYIINGEGDLLLERKLPKTKIVKKLMKFENLICHSSFIFRKDKFQELGGYDENRKYGQDKYLWIKMNVISIIPESLIMYRWHTSNVTHDRYKKSYDLEKETFFHQNRVLCCISSLLIQQGEQLKARKILEAHLNKPRHLFYFVLTFLPSCFINAYMWSIRFWIKRIFQQMIKN